MGILRLLLALSVVISHIGGIGSFVFLGAEAAVQLFFVISGFYMGLILSEKYDRPSLNRQFYLNRALRIFSLYYLYLALAFFIYLGALLLLHNSPLTIYNELGLPTGLLAVIALPNLTVIGLDILLFLKAQGGVLDFTDQALGHPPEVYRVSLLPPAWSLSLELMFYLIAPFVLRRSSLVILSVLACSLALRSAAAVFGVVDGLWSYRFFPFELAWFLLGALAYRGYAAKRAFFESVAARPLAISALTLPILFALLIDVPAQEGHFFWSRALLLLSVAALLPALHGQSCKSTWDRIIGEYSYPVYLGHYLIVLIMAQSPFIVAHRWLMLTTVLAPTFALAWLAIRLVDRPLNRLRQGWAVRAGANPHGMTEPLRSVRLSDRAVG